MGQIGSISTSILRMVPVWTRQRTEIWQVPGQDGYGVQTLGLGDAEFNLSVVLYAEDDDQADNFHTGLSQLQGTIVTVIDDFPSTWPDVLILHVAQPRKQAMIYQTFLTAVRVEVPIRCVTVT